LRPAVTERLKEASGSERKTAVELHILDDEIEDTEQKDESAKEVFIHVTTKREQSVTKGLIFAKLKLENILLTILGKQLFSILYPPDKILLCPIYY